MSAEPGDPSVEPATSDLLKAVGSRKEATWVRCCTRVRRGTPGLAGSVPSTRAAAHSRQRRQLHRARCVSAARVLLALPGRAVRYSRSASTNRRGAWPSGLTSLSGHSFDSPRIYSSSSMNPRARMSAGSSSLHPRADRSGGGARGPGGRVHPEPAGGLRLRGRARRREPLHRPSPARLLRAGGRGGRGVVQQGEFI